jgi:ribonuclease P protein component
VTPPPVRVGRLRDGRAIAATLRGRDKRAGGLLVLHSRARAIDHVAIGYVASKRVGNAVRRNRAKRLLREAAHRLPWSPGREIVLVARSTAADATMGQVHDELEHLARAAGLLAVADIASS